MADGRLPDGGWAVIGGCCSGTLLDGGFDAGGRRLDSGGRTRGKHLGEGDVAVSTGAVCTGAGGIKTGD